VRSPADMRATNNSGSTGEVVDDARAFVNIGTCKDNVVKFRHSRLRVAKRARSTESGSSAIQLFAGVPQVVLDIVQHVTS